MLSNLHWSIDVLVQCSIGVPDTAQLLCVRVSRNRILQDIDRFIHPDQVINRVVYSLDEMVVSADNFTAYTPEQMLLGNFDEQKY